MASDDVSLHPVQEWIRTAEDAGSRFNRKLREICADNQDLYKDAGRMCRQTLAAFEAACGADRDVLVIRSAGRVNLLGTHIDHRGGSVNPVAVNHMWLAVGPREDDLILAKNVESDEFPDEQFRISACFPLGQRIHDWDSWCHDEFEKRAGDASITWSNYVRAAVLYLQYVCTKAGGTFVPALKGMDMMFYGNVPRAVGLSSSSAVVVATAEAVLRVNGLQIARDDLVTHCGHAERYVGTHGGCSDHAAIVFGTCNTLSHITAFPLTVDGASLSGAYRFVLANSLVSAEKRAGARNAFNSRIAAYKMGFMMIRRTFPQYADKLQHLRDVNPTTLDVGEAEIYRIVRSLPASATRVDIVRLLPDSKPEIRQVFRIHDEPEEGYPVRQICLYGITECIRAGMVPDCLHTGDMKRFGDLMNVSHDGDRVSRVVDGKRVPTDNTYPDDRIDALIADLESGDPERIERAHLWRQGGGYNVSLPEVDMLVDIALATPGVMGAGLVGAGMGGCIVAVVESGQAQEVITNMAEQYYDPRSLPVAAEVITPVGGLHTFDL
jgi:N-acetylgalactosamine kinase